MKILMLSQWFDPEPAHKGLAFAKELRRAGHEVSVLTGIPNYPGGKIYPGYCLRPYSREIIDGIRINRVLLYPSHDRSVLRRMLCYASFAFTSTIAIFLLPRPDIVYVYGPPPTAAFGALALRKVRGIPFVMDDHDLWPDTLAATGMVRFEFLFSLIRRWVDYVYREAAHVTVLSPGYRQRLIERGIHRDHVSVFPSWAIEEAASSVRGLSPFSDGTFKILFAGNMGPAQELSVVLEAADQLSLTHPQIRFLFAGSGVDSAQLRTIAEAKGLLNVQFLGRLPPGDMPSVFARADALLVHLRDEPLFAFAIPSKTQAYLQAGKPILMGVSGDAADMVVEAGAGIIFQPGSASALAKAAAQLASTPRGELLEMGRSGSRYYAEKLSRSVGTRRYLALFQKILRAGSAATD